MSGDHGQPSNLTKFPMKHPECRITYFATAMVLIELMTDEGSLRLLTDPVLDAAGSERSGLGTPRQTKTLVHCLGRASFT